jgi:hypothetical protein
MEQAREQEDDQRLVSTNAATLVQAAGVLRNYQEAAPPSQGRGEERISVFWRVFGGTLLSIAALVCITIYQQFTSGLSELRSNINNLQESRGDQVKMEDFNSRTTALWAAVKEVQTMSITVSALNERSALMELQLKQSEEERKSLCRELQQARERLAVVEARLSVSPTAAALPPRVTGGP